MTDGTASEPRLKRLQRGAALLGAAGLGVSLLGGWLRPSEFFPGYLAGFLFWLNLSLGAWALLLVHGLVGGAWGLRIGRVLEAAVKVLPAMALLYVPLVLGLRVLYPWARSDAVEADPHLRHLRPYLNVGFVVIRSAGYFVLWILFSRLLVRRGEGDREAQEARRRRWSAGGLVLYVVTVFFASLDWVLSIEPGWSSSIFGLIMVAGQGLSALALGAAVAAVRARGMPEARPVLNDLGGLLLTAVLLWTYLSFSQYLIIWSENLPRETGWVVRRTTGGWRPAAAVLVVFHFAVPFLLLLFRAVKSSPAGLAAVAGGLLVLRLAEAFWNVLPTFMPRGPELHWATLAAPVGIGGIWVAVFARALRGRPVAPAPAEATP